MRIDTFVPIGTNVRAMGAVGDGRTDDGAAIQRALDQGGLIVIPKGTYIVGKTLFVNSDTELLCESGAIIRLADGALKTRGDVLLTNKDHILGNENIRIRGGFWDGNGKGNPRKDRFDLSAPSGVLFDFRNVRGLWVKDAVLSDPQCYYIRICEVEEFQFEDLLFRADPVRGNQDGIHLMGYCQRGVIRHLRGEGGATGDDFIALNADDCMFTNDNLDTVSGPIRDVLIEDIETEHCVSFVRMLSIRQPIENIVVRRLRGGCTGYALNLDASRFCSTPLCPEDDPRYNKACGRIQNVTVRDVKVCSLKENRAILGLETNVRRFCIEDFTNTGDGPAPSMVIANTECQIIRITDLTSCQLEEVQLTGCSNRVYRVAGEEERFALWIRKPVGGSVILPRGGFGRLEIEPETGENLWTDDDHER